MKEKKGHVVHIAGQVEQPSLSKAQKLFNQQIKKIDKRRQALEEWQATMPLYQTIRATQYDPILHTYNEKRVAVIRLFDTIYSEGGLLSKNEKLKVKEIIATLAAELVDEQDRYGVKELYNKYTDSDFDAEYGAEKDLMLSMIEENFGVRLDDEVDVNSPEELMRHLAEKMQQREANGEFKSPPEKIKKGGRTKSAKTLAKEAEQQEDAKNISQSIREVYRKLASALHPDRESDPVERERKVLLMQRVNVAYDKKDLLKLLELQLEIEQIDERMMATLSDDRLQHYNKVLRDQIQELDMELEMVEGAFRFRFALDPDLKLTPKNIMRELQEAMALIRLQMQGIEEDLISFQIPQNLKKWLKSYDMPQEFDEFDFNEMMAEAISLQRFEESMEKPRKKASAKRK